MASEKAIKIAEYAFECGAEWMLNNIDESGEISRVTYIEKIVKRLDEEYPQNILNVKESEPSIITEDFVELGEDDIPDRDEKIVKTQDDVC